MDKGAQCYERFLNGSDAAFAQIIDEYKDGLMLYINRFVNNIDVAEDLTEDTFVRIVIKKPRFSGTSRFKTWLYAVGRNVAIDYQRRKRLNLVPIDEAKSLPNDEALLERSYIRKERDLAVRKAMNELKPEYARILWLVYFEDFRLKEASYIMKKSLHSTETLVYRARKALKEQLKKEGFIYEDWR